MLAAATLVHSRYYHTTILYGIFEQIRVGAKVLLQYLGLFTSNLNANVVKMAIMDCMKGTQKRKINVEKN